MPSETDVAPKAISGTGMDGLEISKLRAPLVLMKLYFGLGPSVIFLVVSFHKDRTDDLGII